MASLTDFFILFITLFSSLVLLIHARHVPKQPEFVRNSGPAYGLYGWKATDEPKKPHHLAPAVDLTAKYEAYRAAMERQRSSSSKRQGMSDTRFLANGKYYYDMNQEQIDP